MSSRTGKPKKDIMWSILGEDFTVRNVAYSRMKVEGKNS